MVEGLRVTGDKKAAAEQIKGLYNLFAKADCTMVEVGGGGRRGRGRPVPGGVSRPETSTGAFLCRCGGKSVMGGE